jgi:hypothetical protein
MILHIIMNDETLHKQNCDIRSKALKYCYEGTL